MSNQLSVWIQVELKERGWSQYELARRSGLSRSLISKTVANKIPASANFAVSIAHAFGVTPEKTLRLAGILPPLPESVDGLAAELVEIAQSLPTDKQEELLRFARFLKVG